MNLKLSRTQFLELMKLVFVGEFIINGHKIEDFDKPSESLKDYIIKQARENKIEDYIEYYKGSKCYDYTHEKSGEFFGLVEKYCEENFHEDIHEMLSQNMMFEKFGHKKIEDMSAGEYDREFGKMIEVVGNEIQKNDYDNVSIKITNPLFKK